MQHAGLPVASLPMSVVTLNRSPPCRRAGRLRFSQSGQSPDLVDSLRILRERGALGIAPGECRDSPLEAASDLVVPLCAGSERSVAATKSFIATAQRSARLLAHWQRDNALLAAGQGPGGRAGAGRQARLVAGHRGPARLPAADGDRSRRRLRHRPGGRAEIQGNLGDPGRGLQQRRGPPDRWRWSRAPIRCWCSLPAARSRPAGARRGYAPARCAGIAAPDDIAERDRRRAARIRRSIRSWRSRVSTSWPPAWLKLAAWTRTSHGT